MAECVAFLLFRDKDSIDHLVLSYCENCEIFFVIFNRYSSIGFILGSYVFYGLNTLQKL